MEVATDLVKIVIDLPDGDLGVFGEGVWAKPLGGDLYEIRNSPWHSRELNYLDVVQAIAPSPDEKPIVKSLRQRSGHRTIQIILLPDGEGQRDVILRKLNSVGATCENADGKLFALDFDPNIDWEPAREYLQSCMDQNLLEFRWSAWGNVSDG